MEGSGRARTPLQYEQPSEKEQQVYHFPLNWLACEVGDLVPDRYQEIQISVNNLNTCGSYECKRSTDSSLFDSLVHLVKEGARSRFCDLSATCRYYSWAGWKFGGLDSRLFGKKEIFGTRISISLGKKKTKKKTGKTETGTYLLFPSPSDDNIFTEMHTRTFNSNSPDTELKVRKQWIKEFCMNQKLNFSPRAISFR